MTHPIYKTFTLQECDTAISIAGTSRETDPDFFASNVTGASWTMTLTETTDGMAHQLVIRNDAAVDHSGKTVVVAGYNGIYPISETITLPGASLTVKSTKYFTKIPATLTPSATIGTDTMDVGIAEICRTPLIKSCWRGNNEGINTSFDDETAIDYTVKFTRTKVEPDSYQHITNCYTDVYDSLRWFDHDDPDLVDATGDTSSNTQEPPTAYVWEINSYTQSSTPTMYIEATQSSID